MYSTVAAVRARVPALTESVADDTQVEAGIADADAEIDAALGGRFTVPFEASAPAIIASISADLAAAWVLDLTYSGGGENKSPTLSQTLRKRGQDKLMAIAEGEYRGIDTLVSRAGIPGQVERASVRSTTYGQTPLFTDGRWLYGTQGT